MPRRIFVFDPPDRFIADAIGEPGERVFYLQAVREGRVVSVVLEKVQVAALAERLGQLLDELRRHGLDVPEITVLGGDRGAKLQEPIAEAFRVGTMTIAWDGETGRLTIEAREGRDEDEEEPAEVSDDDPAGPDLLRVRMAPAEALTFAERASAVVAAGRPPCPLCGMPLNPAGHLCPRRNGHLN
jgi:uncharacterized repeat protein (TIGR03847 family)